MLAERLFAPEALVYGQNEDWANLSIDNVVTDTRRAKDGSMVMPPVDFFLPSSYSAYRQPATAEYLTELWDSLTDAQRGTIVAGLNQALAKLPGESLCTVPGFLYGRLSDSPAHIIYLKEYIQASYVACRCFYGPLDSELYIVGVTGTNGKTSTVHWLSRYLARCPKLQVASLGTLGFCLDVTGQPLEPTGYTSPPLPLVFERLAQLAASARSAKRQPVLIMELSSHGAVLGRFTGLALDGLVVASLGSDHLDFHGSQTDYLNAKWEVVEHLRRSTKRNRRLLYGPDFDREFHSRLGNLPTDIDQALVSEPEAGSPNGKKERPNSGVSTPKDEKPPAVAYFRIRILEATIAEAKLTVPAQPPHRVERTLTLRPGVHFQIENFGKAAVFGGLACTSPPLEKYIDQTIEWTDVMEAAPVPGRFEVISIPLPGGRAYAVVDFAHTADALTALLTQVRPETQGDLICLFGCGGDRDRGKRPEMGKAASQLSDRIIITSDNPRTEDPQAIIDDIARGVIGGDHLIIVDRRAAILHGVSQLKPQDVLVIAGKGHEDYQIVGKQKLPFSDRQEVLSAIAR